MSDTVYDVEECSECGKTFKPGDEARYLGGEVLDENSQVRLEDPVFLCNKCYAATIRTGHEPELTGPPSVIEPRDIERIKDRIAFIVGENSALQNEMEKLEKHNAEITEKLRLSQNQEHTLKSLIVEAVAFIEYDSRKREALLSKLRETY